MDCDSFLQPGFSIINKSLTRQKGAESQSQLAVNELKIQV